MTVVHACLRRKESPDMCSKWRLACRACSNDLIQCRIEVYACKGSPMESAGAVRREVP